jgi:hypothetical protein
MYNFMGYSLSVLTTLHHHHEHEDDLVFPLMKDKFPEIKRLETDHVHMVPLIDELIEICKKVQNGEQKFDRQVFASKAKALQGFLKPHLAFEEDYFKPEDLEAKKIEPELCQKIHQDIEKTNQARADPFTELPFLLTALAPDEKDKFFGKAPFVARYILFPLFTLRHSGMWKYAKTTGGAAA